MKTMLNICMFSGMCHLDPRCEIPEDKNTILLEKISKLHKKIKNYTSYGFGLGTEHFMVCWDIEEIKEDGFTLTKAGENWASDKLYSIYSDPSVVTLCYPEQLPIYYEDTEDIHLLLAEISLPVLNNFYKKYHE